MVFPHGVPVHLIDRRTEADSAITPSLRDGGAEIPEPHPVSSSAEGGLSSDAGEIEAQAKHARMPEAGENLLRKRRRFA